VELDIARPDNAAPYRRGGHRERPYSKGGHGVENARPENAAPDQTEMLRAQRSRVVDVVCALSRLPIRTLANTYASKYVLAAV